jgi:hypothetical protein
MIVENLLRTINDRRYLVINAPHSVIDGIGDLQDLRGSHPSLLLCQPV